MFFVVKFSTIVMHVSRYWSAYKSEYVNKYGDNEITFHLAFGSEYSLEKLQLEYDQFFIRASQQILSAHKYVGKLCCFSENKKKFELICSLLETFLKLRTVMS